MHILPIVGLLSHTRPGAHVSSVSHVVDVTAVHSALLVPATTELQKTQSGLHDSMPALQIWKVPPLITSWVGGVVVVVVVGLAAQSPLEQVPGAPPDVVQAGPEIG